MKLLRPLLLMLSTIATSAHPAVVRTGDHGDFVRIVIQSKDTSQLSVTGEPGQIIVQRSGDSENFDTSRFFQRIDTSIVENFRVSEDTMVVNLTCNCTFDVFSMAPNLTVIDISKDARPTRGSILRSDPENQNRDRTKWQSSIDSIDEFLKFGVPVPSVTGRLQEEKVEENTTSKSRSEDEKVDTELSAPLRLPILFPQMESTPTPRFETGDENPDAFRDVGISNIEDLARQLSTQVGRAASQGILSHVDEVGDLHEPPSTLNSSIEEKSSAKAQDPRLLSGSIQAHMNIQNPVSEFKFLDDSTSSSLSCEDDALFGIETWATSGNYIEDVAELRRSLFSEFDRVDDSSLNRLVQAYLFFGFGAESLQILELKEVSEKADHAYRIIAHTIDGMGDVIDIAGLAGCASNVSLWAIAITQPGQIEEPNVQAALLALNALPYHLRQVIAPKLSKNLRLAGYLEAASQALRSLRLEPNNPTSEINIAHSEILLSNGETEEAQSELRTISKQNASESPKALTKFLVVQNSESAVTSADLLSLADAYLTELRGNEIRNELLSAYVEALAVSKDYQKAFQIVLKEDLSRDELRKIVAKISSIILEEKSDVDFLTYAAEVAKLPSTLRDPSTDLLMSERLVDLSFAGLAQEIFGDTIDTANSPNAQLLRARIHFAMGDFAETLKEISDLPLDQSKELRAQVAFKTGDYALASRIFREIGQSENAERSSLRIPADEIDIEGAQEFLPTEASNLRQRKFVEPLNGTLESNRSLVEDTASLSSEISELLSSPEFKVQNDPS